MKQDQPLCRIDDIPEGGAIALEDVGAIDESVLLMRRGESVFAYQNVCPHAGRRLDWSPGRFLFDNGLLVCTAHGACFKIEDGLCVSGPCRGEALRVVKIEIDAGTVRLA